MHRAKRANCVPERLQRAGQIHLLTVGGVLRLERRKRIVDRNHLPEVFDHKALRDASSVLVRHGYALCGWRVAHNRGHYGNAPLMASSFLS